MLDLLLAKIVDSFYIRDTYDLVILLLNLFILLVVWRVIVMIVQLSQNKFLGISTKPFSRPGSGGKRILIIGDSTAVGTGAKKPEDTIAGRLAHDFPTADIINVAENGALIRDLHKQIKPLEDQTFDLIIVSAGGNDVWHLTRYRSIRKHLIGLLPTLVKMSSHRVLFLIYNNIGSAPVFPKILTGFLTRRCNRVQDTIYDVSISCGVPIIELFTDTDRNPFLKDPETLFAADGIHPSSDGYRLWYHRMWRVITERGY